MKTDAEVIAEVRELDAKATKGPFITEYPSSDAETLAKTGRGHTCIGIFSKHEDHDKPTDGYVADIYGGMVGSQDITTETAEANAKFFAASRTLLPDLAARLTAANQEIAEKDREIERTLRDLLDLATGYADQQPSLWRVEEAIRAALSRIATEGK